MITSSTTSTSASTAATLGSTASTAKSDANAQQDRFLKLLVAQLNNQDPMNPMDNAQMTSQMAQINTVSGITQLNETMKSMSTQFSAMQVLQGASMVGHEVLTEGNTLTVNAGVGKAAIDLSGIASKVTVQVLGSSGQVLDTINLGPQTAGRHNFEWDASSYTGTTNPTFKVTALQGTTAVGSTSLMRSPVESITTDAGAMNLTLKSGKTVAYDAIKAIL
jgi:flagellar basal-body rod modification protein FlgD